MVKGVTKSIITVAVLMGSLVACGGAERYESGTGQQIASNDQGSESTTDDSESSAADVETETSESITCVNLFKDREVIPAREYLLNLKQQALEAYENSTYWYTDPNTGNTAINGPRAYWLWQVFYNDVSTSVPEPFESVNVEDTDILWEDYVAFSQAVCDAEIGVSTRRQTQILFDKLFEYRTDWPGHASKWEPFPYIETGAEVIDAPSPNGLEHYTKYITGAGVIIVAGKDIPDEALLTARESVIYLTSARPEFRDILKANEARISLFTGVAGVLPEYPTEDEPGGFAMGMNDVSMTANADWLCWPDHWDAGGDPVIHEMIHTINHLVFEEINEVYFYERIYDLALKSIENGIFFTGFEQNLPEGQEQDMTHYVGEYWAMSVEGYIMDRPGLKYSHDTREWIAENDPELFELITRYYPTEEWEFCKGIDKFYLGEERGYEFYE